MTEQKPTAECFCQQLVRPLEKQRMWCGLVTGDKNNIHDESTRVDRRKRSLDPNWQAVHGNLNKCCHKQLSPAHVHDFVPPYSCHPLYDFSVYLPLQIICISLHQLNFYQYIYICIYIYTSFDSILDTTTSTISFHLSSKSYSSHFMCRCPTPKKWEDRKIMWIHWDMMDNRVRHLGWSTLVVTLGDQSTRYTLWSINLLTLKLSNL